MSNRSKINKIFNNNKKLVGVLVVLVLFVGVSMFMILPNDKTDNGGEIPTKQASDEDSVFLTVELDDSSGDISRGTVSVNGEEKDVAGEGVFEVPKDSEVTVSVVSDEYQDTTKVVTIDNSNKTTTIVLEQSSEPNPNPQDVTLTVSLENAEGEFVQGEVNVGHPVTEENPSTASLFKYEVDTDNTVTVYAAADGYQDTTRTVDIGTEDKRITIILQPTEK